MINKIFDGFERSELSDDIFSIFGRALTVKTRFNSSCKVLARLPSYKSSFTVRKSLSDDEYGEVVNKIHDSYKNLNCAIDSLKFEGDIKQVLTNAREARNELIHEGTLGACTGFDGIANSVLKAQLNHIQSLVYKVIKGETLVSAILSTHSKEPISDYPFSESYEKKYVNWVMERFDT